MPRGKQVYETSAKIIYEGSEADTHIQHFKDDPAKGRRGDDAVALWQAGRGVLNNRISDVLMTRLTEMGVANHLMRRLNMREQMVRASEPMPIGVKIRNLAAGAFASRLGMPPGVKLPRPMVEFFLRSTELDDPLITEDNIAAFNWASPQDLDDIVALSMRTNDILSGLFIGVGLKLVDFRLEFGRIWEPLENGQEEMRILIADEITPDNCRLWDNETGEKLETLRDSATGLDGHRLVAARLGLMPDAGPGDLRGPRTLQ
ncbi:MAG: phosphoribosylaminoimidazolesuccinocarboxamide synthase [Rhodospirillaceae bacterium]|nr:phosphoribosylaminoimidazolesuccinocarboxamide synthase [Rhodospirillaceae bacterium]MAV48116.1 phosphoribosylaminoimidazolesuccinocarboxamide synthase [Rhodospirillaceae bacterium]